MIDITAVPTRVLTCPFPLIEVKSIMSHIDWDMLLLIGRDRACIASLQNNNAQLNKFIPQYHRKLTTSACRVMDTNDSFLYTLADETSTVTLHRSSRELSNGLNSLENTSGTIFIGNAWDNTPQINCIIPVWGTSEVDAVCTRKNEIGIMWAMSFEREEARIIKVDKSIKRFFSQQQALSGYIVGATSHTISLISPTIGETLLEFKLPKNTGDVEAVEASFNENSLWFSAVTNCGTALVYDKRRGDQPLWSRNLWTPKSNNNNNFDSRLIMANCGPGVCSIYSSEQLHFLRYTSGSVACRSFSLPKCFLPSNLDVIGICFSNTVLHIIGNNEEIKSKV